MKQTLLLVVGLLGLGGPRAVRAQTPAAIRGADLTAALVDSITKAAVKTTPRFMGDSQVVIDPKTRTAQLLLRNPGPNIAVVEVNLQFAPLTPFKPMLAEELLTEDAATVDSLTKEEQRVAGAGKQWSLASWTREALPLQLWLKPYQTVQLTLHFTVPDTVPPGEYSGYFVVRPMIWREIYAGVVAIIPGVELAAPPSAVRLAYRTGRTVE